MSLSLALWHFLLMLMGGTFLGFLPIKGKLVGKRYFLYHALIILSVALGLFWWRRESLSTIESTAFLLFMTAQVGLLLLKPGTFLHFFNLALGSASFLFMIRPMIPPLGISPLKAVHVLTEPLLLGLTMSAMLLGHWYLVQPKLPIDELKRVCSLWVAVLTLRLLTTSYFAYQHLEPMTEVEIYRYLMGHPHGLMLLMRYLWGLVLPWGLSFFILSAVRIRSTQSATGMLYVAVLAVITGEILNAYLSIAWNILP